MKKLKLIICIKVDIVYNFRFMKGYIENINLALCTFIYGFTFGFQCKYEMLLKKFLLPNDNKNTNTAELLLQELSFKKIIIVGWPSNIYP